MFDDRRARRLILLLSLAAALPFLPSLGYDFVFDDLYSIVENEKLHTWSAVGESLQFWNGTILNYRPVRFASLAIDWNLAGGAAWMFHLTNILLHVGCTLLCVPILQRLGVGSRVAWLTAFAFAVLPVHVGAVDYVSGRKDLLASLFYLGSIGAFLRFRETRRAVWALGCLSLGVLAAFTKELAVTLPVVLLFIDAWRTDETREVWKRRGAFYMVWAAGGAAYLLYKLVVWPATKVDQSQWFDFVAHTGTAAHLWTVALTKLLLPLRSLPDYQGMFTVGQGWDGTSFVGLALFVALMFGAWRWRRSIPAATAGIVFMVLSWAPMSGVFPIAELFSEHYLYLPSLGMCLALAALADTFLVPRLTPSLQRGLGVAVVVVAMLWTAWIGRVWADPQSVWETSWRLNPKTARAPTALSLIYQDLGRYDEARAMGRIAVEMTPDYDIIQANYASILLDQGLVEESLVAAEEGLKWIPDSYRVRIVIARALRKLGRRSEAIEVSREVCELEPVGEHFGLLGEDLYLEGRLAEAREALTKAVELDEDYSQAWTNLGLVAVAQRNASEAEAAFRRAIDLSPEDPDPYNNLAVLLFRTGRIDEARAAAAESVRLGRPLHPEFRKALDGATGP